ncbi:hypothetical protein PoB_002987400 [Plakobranchus ocellatus]|uniref:Uncharacterized protein n=1 Tax=Plakobranchus ocellatus TaxID=259542 RepID=A0AAV4AA90_9GAST|nr:hypothetical protein PoB_002987400 [Plakobranchus ocellatus]
MTRVGGTRDYKETSVPRHNCVSRYKRATACQQLAEHNAIVPVITAGRPGLFSDAQNFQASKSRGEEGKYLLRQCLVRSPPNSVGKFRNELEQRWRNGRMPTLQAGTPLSDLQLLSNSHD